jgi:hypothetical protein
MELLLGFAAILGFFGLWAFIEHAWRNGLAATVGRVTEDAWMLTKWIGGIAAVIAVFWWLGPLWSIVVLLVLIFF